MQVTISAHFYMGIASEIHIRRCDPTYADL
jgi:hypothetical protein